MFQGDLELESVFEDHGVCSEVIAMGSTCIFHSTAIAKSMCGELGVRLWTQIVAGPAYIQKMWGEPRSGGATSKTHGLLRLGKPLSFNASVSC